MPFASSVLNIYPGTDTIQQLCDIIETSTKFYGGPVTDVEVSFALSIALAGGFGEEPTSLEALFDLIECLLEAGIIVEGDPNGALLINVFTPDDSISSTGTNEINLMCTNGKGCINI
jgi:hypothetical protein